MTDVFDDAFALLAAAADVKGFEARIMRLKKLSEQVAAEQAKLDADRAAHARKLEADTAEMDEREQKLRARHLAVSIAEREVNEARERYAAALPPRYPHDPNIFGTLTREPYTDG
jgi:hypothetical protein